MTPFARWFLGGLVAGAALVAVLPERAIFVPAGSARAAAGGVRHACPMLCTFADHPGRCPVCGMEMTPVGTGLGPTERERIGLSTVVVAEGPARITVRGSGLADYDHRFTTLVTARVAGRVVRRHQATYGCCQVVKANEPVLELYSPEAYRAQGELAAAARLGDQALVASLRERFAAWNLAAVADAVLAGAAPVDTVTVRTTAGGLVFLPDLAMLDQTLMVGNELAADTPLLRLADPDRLVVTLAVDEVQARFLREDQPATLESDDRGPLPELSAKVGRVAAEISPRTRTREVRLYVEQARPFLQPGSLVRARIRAALDRDLGPARDPERDAALFPLIPKTAVLSTGARHLAWKALGPDAQGRERYEPANLALGPRLESEDGRDLYVIRAGLKPGERVVESGLFLVDAQAQLAGKPSLIEP